MAVIINVSLDEDSLKKLDQIVKAEFSDRSKLFRKWIYQNYKEEYKGDLNE